MKTRPWTEAEIKFVRDNGGKGVVWLVKHMNRSLYGIQRIAFVHCFSLNNERKKKKRGPVPRSPASTSATLDAVAQSNVKFMQENLW